LKIKDITKKVKVGDQANDVRQFLKTFDVSSHLTEQKKSLQKLVTQLSKQCQDYRKAIFVSRPTVANQLIYGIGKKHLYVKDEGRTGFNHLRKEMP
jgi:hypothetical protein